jgi:hypothetical protein
MLAHSDECRCQSCMEESFRINMEHARELDREAALEEEQQQVKGRKQRAATPSLVALCTKCDCIVACAVQRPEYAKDNAKVVAAWVRGGCAVKTISAAEVRAAEWCKCGKGGK